MGNHQVEVGGALRGFLRDRRDRYRIIQVPGSLQTQAAAINDRGQIIGLYAPNPTDPAAGLRGFLLDRGRYTTFDPDNAALTSPLASTTAA